MQKYVAKIKRGKRTQMKKYIIQNICYFVLLALMVALFAGSIAYYVARKKGMSFTVIISNSMTPEYNVLDTVIYSPKTGDRPYVPGDNIVFLTYENDGDMAQYFHKLIMVSENYDRFYTKGIANNSQDEGFRQLSDIIGSEDYHIKVKLFGMLVILLSQTDSMAIFWVFVIIILVLTFLMIVQIFIPRISKNEAANLDKSSTQEFSNLLRQYNACKGDPETTKEILAKINRIKVRLNNVDGVVCAGDPVVPTSTQKATNEEHDGRKKSKKVNKAVTKVEQNDEAVQANEEEKVVINICEEEKSKVLDSTEQIAAEETKEEVITENDETEDDGNKENETEYDENKDSETKDDKKKMLEEQIAKLMEELNNMN